MILFKFKNILLVFFIVLLLLQLEQYIIPFIKEKPFGGEYLLSEKSNSLFENWFSGGYQMKNEPYFNENICFRSFLIRINYQIKYSFFSIIKIGLVVLSKNVMVLLITELNLKFFDEIFTQRFVKLFNEIDNKNLTNEINEENNSEILAQIEIIKSNKEWFELVKKNAIERNSSVDKMLHNTGVYWQFS